MNNRFHLLATLASLDASYPYGVAAALPTAIASRRLACFIDSRSPSAAADSTMLRQMAVNGLRLAEEDFAIIQCDRGVATPGEGRLNIILGSSVAEDFGFGKETGMLQRGDTYWIIGFDGSDLRAHPEVKREFWNLVQAAFITIDGRSSRKESK